MAFAAALLDSLARGGRRIALDAAAARALDDAFAQAAGEWPQVRLAVASFAGWVVERIPSDAELPAALAALRLSDLYVACACACGDAGAIAAFEHRYFAEVLHATRRSTRLRCSDDDVRQMVRERIFVATGGTSPRIAEYRGHGSIRSWLRVVATRVVLSLVAKPERDMPTEAEMLADIAAGDGDVELEHLKRVYRADFKAAVDDALVALDPKDRNVLSYAFAQGLGIDQLGAIYGVHRATAARWVTKAREALVEETRRALMTRLGATDSEVDSIVRMIQSRFDVTLGGLMRKGEGG